MADAKPDPKLDPAAKPGSEPKFGMPKASETGNGNIKPPTPPPPPKPPEPPKDAKPAPQPKPPMEERVAALELAAGIRHDAGEGEGGGDED